MTTDVELLSELITDIYRDLHPIIQTCTSEELNWQPGVEANSIGVTLWHIARGLDLLGTRVLQSKSDEDELWHTNGWRERTGYDPRGIGYRGWGVVTGYTWDEVQLIPKMRADEILVYLNEVCSMVSKQVHNFNSETARQPATSLLDGKLTYYQWIKEFYKGFQAHVGEIIAIQERIKKETLATDQG